MHYWVKKGWKRAGNSNRPKMPLVRFDHLAQNGVKTKQSSAQRSQARSAVRRAAKSGAQRSQARSVVRRARRYSGQEFYKSFEKYKVWKLTILARLGGMLCVFNCLARLGVCCVFSIAFLDFYAQHVYNSTPILTSLRSLDLNFIYVNLCPLLCRQLANLVWEIL